MSAIRLPLTLALTALLAACAQQPHHSVTVSKEQQCPALLGNGKTLTLILPTNPTTGYRWQVKDAAAAVMHPLSPEVYSNPEDAGVVGAAGQSIWRFQAHAVGTGRLLLVLQQPWAPEVMPVQTFDCAIEVR